MKCLFFISIFQARPGDIVSTAAVRQAMGITMEPVPELEILDDSSNEAIPVARPGTAPSDTVPTDERDELEDFAEAPDEQIMTSTQMQEDDEDSVGDDDDEDVVDDEDDDNEDDREDSQDAAS